MSPTIYELSIPVYIRSLENLIHVLRKGEEWAKQNNIDPDTLAQARLAPDMNVSYHTTFPPPVILTRGLPTNCTTQPLIFQIQASSDTSKGTLKRLGISELASMPDDEATYAQLYPRLQKTIDLLKAAKPEDFEGKENADVLLLLPGHPLKFTGVSYLQAFGEFLPSRPRDDGLMWKMLDADDGLCAALPNFFFHVATAYGILRKEGFQLGKLDYMGNINSYEKKSD